MKNLSEQEIVRREKAEKIRALGINPWNNFDNKKLTHNSKQLHELFNLRSKEALHLENHIVTIAGRIMTIREPFFVIQDPYGRMQAYFNRKTLTDYEKLFDLLDIGDIVYITGSVMKTNKGELTVRVSHLELLTKSLIALPEKFHGLKDTEERYRKRYVDLIVNESVRETFRTRSKIISLIRNYFDNLDFLEAETPILHSVLGGANAKPFLTHHNALNQRFNLRIATELPLKQLIVGGFAGVYEIGRIFRNEGIDTTHNPEFTSIEFYQAYGNMESILDITEGVFKYLAIKLNKQQIEYKGVKIDFTKPFKRLNMVDAVSKATGYDFRNLKLDLALEVAKKHKIKIEKYYTVGHIINELFEVLIEETLLEPTFVYGHPIEISPLANKNPHDPRFTDRAELFIAKKEYANLFTELSDPLDQRKRFEDQLAEKAAGNDEATEIDETFLNALEYGMPPAGGSGIGIDRLVMLFTNQESIREVLLFPTLKDEK
ncbi:lysine--tRNA ligase [Mycoplasmopsis agassizii]|uniref:Lysine--tRNA ligase n=1 Tax=Mycoplasmopsis agassizii TaxID=33922 RepID=A0ABX4H427_9BACT|nr:lysine--tRNA ligase [Mycoplasmopsis agassizii]PAF54640.1 lysine--tRNA ligase [Mycoplasmopsis agassizii]SMC16224.1 lysyl-tRNA synthetase, class II [Mycoplasmopsis agassizii]